MLARYTQAQAAGKGTPNPVLPRRAEGFEDIVETALD